MNFIFSVKKARNELINKLKENGEKDEKIKEIIDNCDKDYIENGIPYPRI